MLEELVEAKLFSAAQAESRLWRPEFSCSVTVPSIRSSRNDEFESIKTIQFGFVVSILHSLSISIRNSRLQVVLIAYSWSLPSNHQFGEKNLSLDFRRVHFYIALLLSIVILNGVHF